MTRGEVREARPFRFPSDRAPRGQRQCARCHRLAKSGSTLCRLHKLDILSGRPTPEAWAAFEELTEAVRDLLWEQESRARRGVRQAPRDSPLWHRVRLALRRAEDMLAPY